mgnify:CR=1 FL=1
MNRRDLLRASALVPLAAGPVVAAACASRATAQEDDFESIARRAHADLIREMSRVGAGSAEVIARTLSLSDQPGVLAGVSFLIDPHEVGRVAWARPVLLMLGRYGSCRDTAIVCGDELLDLTLCNSRPWNDLDPGHLMDRWRLLLEEAKQAILDRAAREVASQS